MARKHEFVKKNISVLRKLVRSGDISGRVLTEFRIYGTYKQYKAVKSKMERYQFVASDLKTSPQAVMRAVKSMESSI